MQENCYSCTDAEDRMGLIAGLPALIYHCKAWIAYDRYH